MRTTEAKRKSNKENAEAWTKSWQEASQMVLSRGLSDQEAQQVRETLNLPQDAAVTQREAILARAVELAKQGKKEWAVFLLDMAEPKEQDTEEETFRLPELGSMTDQELQGLARKIGKASREVKA